MSKWRVLRDENGDAIALDCPDKLVLHIYSTVLANRYADEIVQKLNDYERLLVALKRIVTVYEECDCTAEDLYLIAVKEVGSKRSKAGIETHEALASTPEPSGEHDWSSSPDDANLRCRKCGRSYWGTDKEHCPGINAPDEKEDAE